MTARLSPWLRSNWFVLVLPLLLLVEWLVVRSLAGEMGQHVEAVVLFDLCLFMPALYLLCYRGSLPLKRLALRALGLACLGMYLATYIVPEAAQQLLPHLAWARTVSLPVIALIEIVFIVTVVRLVWRSDATVERVQAASGAPAWVARLMLLEARMWKALWRLIRRR